MPAILRSRLAVVAFLGVFLIPIATSSLRGLSHVLTCEQAVESPFSVVVGEDGSAVVVSSTTVVAGQEAGLCGGLAVDLLARPDDPGRIALTVALTNHTDHPWLGTVNVALDGYTIPISIGRVLPGEAQSDTVVFRLDPGTHELAGSLLVGP